MNNRHEDDPVFEFFEICISCNFCKLVFWRDSGMKKSARMTQKVSQRRQTTRPDVDEEPFMSSWAWWQASRMRSRVHRPLEWARNGAGSTAQDGTRKCPRGLPDWSSRDQRNHVWNFPAIRHRSRWKQDVKFCADTQIQSLLVVTETVQIQYHPSKVIKQEDVVRVFDVTQGELLRGDDNRSTTQATKITDIVKNRRFYARTIRNVTERLAASETSIEHYFRVQGKSRQRSKGEAKRRSFFQAITLHVLQSLYKVQLMSEWCQKSDYQQHQTLFLESKGFYFYHDNLDVHQLLMIEDAISL